MARLKVIVPGLIAVVLGVGTFAVLARRPAERPEVNSPVGGTPLRWIVAGGGPTPESNEVSIEDDLALASNTLTGPGRLLYAGGARTMAVRVEAGGVAGDPLVQRLGRIFDPRPARGSKYQKTRLDADGPATADALLREIRTAVASEGAPLTVWISGHGDRGETAAQNAVLLWGNDVLTPVDLAVALDEAPLRRQTRFVMTTCFSGGFAELAFAEANAEQPAVEGDVCGLFASTWDREAGGCDPNPDRGRHDGYAVHFLNALAGTTRDGKPIAKVDVDFDGDGNVSYLDAHTWARLHSGSIDVPTTTSERWLRQIAADAPDVATVAEPHEDAVVRELEERLGVSAESDARDRLAAIEAQLADLREAEASAAEAEGAAYRAVAAELLSRWPVLNDPWHPDWPAVIEKDRKAIEGHLASSESHQALEDAMTRTDAAAAAVGEKEVERTPYERLLRAYETKRMITALQNRGDEGWERFRRFRDCERSGP